MQNWLKITEIKFKNTQECIYELKNKGFFVSAWIDNIVEKYNYKFEKLDKAIILNRVKLREFGFDGPTELKDIYQKFNSSGLNLVKPEIVNSL